MELIVDIIANILLAVGVVAVQWCIRHKHATYAIIVIILMIIDVLYLLRVFGII